MLSHRYCARLRRGQPARSKTTTGITREVRAWYFRCSGCSCVISGHHFARSAPSRVRAFADNTSFAIWISHAGLSTRFLYQNG